MRKRCELIFLLVLILFSPVANATEISIEYIRQVNQNENFGVSNGGKISIEKNNIYGWLSGERSPFSLVGQCLDSVDLFGAGIGLQHEFKNGFIFYLDGGWYYPYHRYDNKKLSPHNDGKGDRLEIYLNEKYADVYGKHYFDYYIMHMTGNFGATVGVTYKIKNYIFSFGYRMLEIPLSVGGRMNDPAGLIWDSYENQNVSGAIFGTGIVW